MHGHGEQSKQGVYDAEAHGAFWVSPEAQAVQLLHAASLAVPHAGSAYWVAEHAVQDAHWGLFGLVQGATWYFPALQLAHALHWRSLLAPHGAYW